MITINIAIGVLCIVAAFTQLSDDNFAICAAYFGFAVGYFGLAAFYGGL